MFAFSETRGQARPPIPTKLLEMARPVVAASSRTLPLANSIAEISASGSLRRGSVTVVSGPIGSGAVSLALSLAAGASAEGHWCGVLGISDPGAVAMGEVGMDLRRVLFTPDPGRQWFEVALELLDGVELLILRLGAALPFSQARRLVARARERRAAIIVVTDHAQRWPLAIDLGLCVRSSSWLGIGRGEGHLSARRLEVEVVARGEHLRVVSAWVPSPAGELSMISAHG